MNKKLKKIYFLIFSLVLLPSTVFAGNKVSDADKLLGRVQGRTGLSNADVPTLVGNGIRSMLQLVSLLFFGLMLYGGFLWLTARGNDDQVDKARKTIVAAVIGLVIVIAAYAVTVLVTGRLI